MKTESAAVFLRKKGLNHGFKLEGSKFKGTLIDLLNEFKAQQQVKNCSIQNVSVRSYSEKDIIKAAKYGYEYRDTTSFPELSFEDNCENNVKQWIVGVLNAR